MNDTADFIEGSLIGEFISVPAWNLVGQVIDESPAAYGPDDAIRVLLQADPHRLGRARWFHLERGQYEFV